MTDCVSREDTHYFIPLTAGVDAPSELLEEAAGEMVYAFFSL